jgi:phage protein U
MADLKDLTSGSEMGKLGDFVFYMKKNEYEKISQTLTASFGSYKPIKGQERLSKVGGYENKISLNGVLVLCPLKSLETLEDYLKARKPLDLTTLTDDIKVVITSLTITQSHFLDNGNFTAQTYSLSLKEVYDEIL